MIKSIKYNLYKFNKKHPLLIGAITGIALGAAVVTSLYFLNNNDDDILNDIDLHAPSQIENTINPGNFVNRSNECNGINKPVDNNTINYISGFNLRE